MAPPVAGRTVVSYTAFPPLPEPARSADPGGIFLLHWPWSRLHRTLSGILPCEARTFLTRRRFARGRDHLSYLHHPIRVVCAIPKTKRTDCQILNLWILSIKDFVLFSRSSMMEPESSTTFASPADMAEVSCATAALS